MASKAKVYIVIYTVYHHIHKLAVEIQKGLDSSGVTSSMFQVRETLPENVLQKIKAPPKPDIPIISPEQLVEPDGILFGYPTRFGMLPSQMKALLDGTGALWANGALHGKFTGTFTSTGSQLGGRETTGLTTMPYFAHHGMVYVPFGFASPHMYDNNEVIGGSAYGAGTVAGGDGSRQPSAKELDMAHLQGENFGKLVRDYIRGRDAFKSQGKTQ